MVLVAPDILAEVLRLSFGAQMIGLGLGLALWMTGWMRRNFWIALSVTAGFGLYGLHLGRATGTHPLVTALILGISAGILANELSRLIAFVTGGLAAAVLVQTFFPSFHEPLLVYLVGGLVCVLMFKIWLLALFGFAGAILIVHCALPLVSRFMGVNPLALAAQKTTLLNWAVLGGTGLGMYLQHQFEHRIATAADRMKSKAMRYFSDKEKAALEGANPPAKPRMWGLVKPKRVA
jgi:hypothetical protein